MDKTSIRKRRVPKGTIGSLILQIYENNLDI
jgi:hypothetical protein